MARVPSSPAAQIAHAELYERWLTFQHDSREQDSHAGPVAEARLLSSRDRLIPDLERFTILYAGDPVVPFARACLALLYLDKGDLVHAGLSLGELTKEQVGTTRDLATLARAKLLRLRRKPADALEILRPLERNDAVMARELLDGGHVLGRELGIPLEDLAGSTKGQRVVRGRTVGLLLPVGTVGLREAAAETVRGVAWSLGLSALPSTNSVTVANDGSRLVTRDAGEGGARLEEALEELAGEGATVIIAGLDSKSATRALAWGDLVNLSVISLAVPEGGMRVARGVVLGVPLGDQVAVLGKYFQEHKAPSVTLIAGNEVGSTTDVTKHLAKAGVSLTLMPPFSCDLPPAPAGALRFPLREAARKKSVFWVAGSSECVRDVATDLTDVDRRATLISTLEGGIPTADVRLAEMKFVTVSSGLVPVLTERAEEVTGAEIRSYMKTYGLNPSYWAALGRDAGALAMRAMAPLPLDSVAEERAIYQRRAVVEGGLLAAQLKYWTSSATTLGADRHLPRTLKTVEWKGGI